MARGPFPTGDFGRNLSDNIYQPNHTADTSSAGAAAIADGARGFSRVLGQLAEKAYQQEGLRDAAEAFEAGDMIGAEPRIRTGRGVDDVAYNTAVRERTLARKSTAFGEELEAAVIANPDNLAAFEEARAAVREAFKPSGDPALDLALGRSIELQTAEARSRVRIGEERRRVATARGAFVEVATAGQTALGQAIASAGFDEPGAARVGEALTQFYERLSRFGPREAFTVGGVEFAGDPTRAAAMSAQELATLAAGATVTARMSWIENAGAAIADPMAMRAFVGQVQERWQAGDAAFAGLDAADMDRLGARLEAGASRLDADRAARVTQAGQLTRDMLEAGEYGGEVDPETLRRLAAASGDVGLQAQAEFALAYGFDVTPASLRAGAGGGSAGFEGAIPFLLDDLEGSALVGNDNGAGRAQFGITERSHPSAWRDGRVDRAEATAIYRREYWDAIGGDALPADLGIAALATAAVAGAGVARELIEQSGGDVERFLSLEMGRFERLAAEDPARYGDDLNGWRARQGKVRGMIQRARAQRRAQDGYSTDPLGFARGNATRAPLATLPEFDPAAGFASAAEAGDWAAALRARRATGQALSQRDGVPARILDNEEARFYASQIAADPGNIVTLAANAATALGGEGARDFFAELGRAGVAGADLHLAWLATEPRNRNIVNLTVEGRVLRASGAKEPTFEDETIDQALPRFAEALRADPAVTPAIAQLARDMAMADAARGQLKPAASYLQSALGATTNNGVTFGGVATVNGQRTVAPAWLEADRLEDALEIAAGGWTAQNVGPVYQNGEPIPVGELRRYRLTALPDGRYRLTHPRTGAALPARSGQEFRFDIEAPAFRELLNRRLPGAVLGAR